jgi:hypothetical protein
LSDTLGNIVGDAFGWTETIDIMDGDSANPKYITERTALSVLNFGDENEIVIQGIYGEHHGEQRISLALDPIVGGTGKYKGAEGEMKVTRKADSTIAVLLNIKTVD